MTFHSICDKIFFMTKNKRIGVKTCGLIWEESFRLMWRYPKLFLPSLILILLEILLLVFLFLNYLPIFSPLLGPPIKVFFGEIYRHYPYNLVLLPTLFDCGDIVLSVIFATLITGMTVAMIYQAQEGNIPKFGSNLLLSLKKYLILLGLGIIVTLLVFGTFQLGNFLVLKFYTEDVAEFIHIPTWRMFRLTQYFCFFLSLVIETFFAFCIPAIMIEKKKIIGSMKRSFKLGFKLFLPTFILICVPTIFDSLIVLIKQKMLVQLMDKFYPEVVFVIMGLGFCLYLLTQVVRISSLTLLFLHDKNEK